MLSTMQDFPLTVGMIFRHGRTVFGDSEVVTFEDDSSRRASFADVANRVDQLSAALRRLGMDSGDRVGTFGWNTQEHLEAYFAIPCMGGVLHTLNIRLFPDQLVYIVNHAEDRIVIVDGSLLPVLAKLAPELPSVEYYLVVGDADTAPLEGNRAQVLRYDELLAAERPGIAYPEIDERAAAAMCYTSGTTGNPKGVVYSHRSTFLHSIGVLQAGAVSYTDRDRVLPVVPMFHANAWGMPYAAWMAGADLIMPNRYLQAEPLARLIQQEKPTCAGAVPTIWTELLHYGEANPVDLSSLQKVLCGGSAVPRSLIEGFEAQFGVRIVQGWGMTETSPLAAMSWPPKGVELGTAQEMDWRGEVGTRHRRRRAAHRRRRRHRAPVGRRSGWRGSGARAVGHRRVLPRPRPAEIRRRLAPHRRHRERHAERLHPDHRPREGRHQVRRGMDLVGRARSAAHGASGGGGGRGDRGTRSALGGATACMHRGEERCRGDGERAARLPR